MSKSNDRMIYQKDGKWINKANGNSRASTTHDLQKDAYDTARSMLQKTGGGEITIKPGNDPRNIKG